MKLAFSVLMVGLLGVSIAAQSTARGADPDRSRKNVRRITTDHLQIATYTTEDVIAPGSVFFLVFDITPRNGVHVYAPGDHRYRIIRLTLERNPRLVAHPLDYPESEMYLFAPLNERVAVFQRPFTLVQRIGVSASPQQRGGPQPDQMTIRGTLDYQACDERVCFLPQSVPVSYTVRVQNAR